MRGPSKLPHHPRRGTGLVEVMIAATILVVVILAIFGLVRRDTELSRATLGIAVAEIKAQEMLRKLETELADGRGWSPRGNLVQPLTAEETNTLSASTILGFPDVGMLLIDRGTAAEERIRYQRTAPATNKLRLLSRGRQCTTPAYHPAGAEFMWSGLAEPIELQDPPPPEELFDGVALEPTGPLFFRGDGAGFSYRVPVDPTDSTPPNYIADGEVQWGAEVEGLGTTAGWTILYFAPDFEIFEGDTRDDINGDGDFEDRFEVGQIRRRVWNRLDATVEALDVGLGPRSILQERCNWGGDLDNDGFDDPIFLWDENGRWLHIRLYVLGRSVSNIPIVRRVESMVFLRNEPEN